MTTGSDPTRLASELRLVLGGLVRRLRVENRLPLPQSIVLSRIDREGPSTVSGLAAAEHIRPQSMAQTVADLEADGLVSRSSDPTDRRRWLVELTADGKAALAADRRVREGWLADAIADLAPDDQNSLERTVDVLRQLADRE